MSFSRTPAGMRCSPSILAFVQIFESSNELSLEDFSSFKYSNLRSKIFLNLTSCFRRTELMPQRHDLRQEHLPRVVHNWLSPQPQRSADLEPSPSPLRRLDDPLDFGSKDSEEYDPDYVVVNEVFDVSAKFDTCCQVIVESGVSRPYLDLILGRSVPNQHTPIFRDPNYAWLAPLSTYGRCFGKWLSANCKDVSVKRDLPCALVACAFPFAVPNKKGTPTPIIRLLALVWHAYGAVES